MSQDPQPYGDSAHPVRQDPTQYIIAVHWGDEDKITGPVIGSGSAIIFGPQIGPTTLIGPNPDFPPYTNPIIPIVPIAPIVGGFAWGPCTARLIAEDGDVHFADESPESFAIPRNGFWTATASLGIRASYGKITGLQIALREANAVSAGPFLQIGSSIDIDFGKTATCSVSMSGASRTPLGASALFVSVWGICETCPELPLANIIMGDRTSGTFSVTHFAPAPPP